MSDKTPTGAADNDGEPQESVEPAEQSAEDKSSDTDASEAGETAPAIVRKTAAAPKRRKKSTADSDDEAIAALEKDFSADEQAAAAGIRRRTAKAPVKKQTKTRTQDSARSDSESDPYSTKNPVTFTQQSVGELKRVVWPSGRELRTYFVAVLVFVVFMITYVGLLDLSFGWGLLNLLGD